MGADCQSSQAHRKLIASITLSDNVQTPMSESDWVSRAEITALFGGLEGIKGVNDILLSQLETARDEGARWCRVEH